jgi:uncharacterized protein
MSDTDVIEAFDRGDAARVRELVTAEPTLANVRKDGMSLLLLGRYQNDRSMTEALLSAGRPLDVYEAATFDDASRLAALLAAQPDLCRQWSPDGFTALHLSAFFGGVEGARLLLDAGAELNVISRNDFAVAPLNSAAAGRIPVALLLIERGADVNVQQRHGWTALHAAAQSGSTELLEALLRAGADPSITTDDGVTALGVARKGGHEAIAKRLEDAATSPQ